MLFKWKKGSHHSAETILRVSNSASITIHSSDKHCCLFYQGDLNYVLIYWGMVMIFKTVTHWHTSSPSWSKLGFRVFWRSRTKAGSPPAKPLIKIGIQSFIDSGTKYSSESRGGQGGHGTPPPSQIKTLALFSKKPSWPPRFRSPSVQIKS